MKKPLKEWKKVKEYLELNYGKGCYKHGRVTLGCVECWVWRAIDLIEQALED